MSQESLASHAAVEYLRWSLTPEVGPILFGRLIEHFGSASRAWEAGLGQLKQVDGIGPVIAEAIATGRPQADVAAELDLAAQHGVRVICPEDEEYPPALKHIPDAPICLYVKGRIDRHDAVAIGIVGARRCTIYGREQ
ncbi:MAG: DNA-processing protein DprA, partial [Phycisphaerae bacterium]|nr:DNA-processing protein DprA [Phycisphaerae bacterium]